MIREILLITAFLFYFVLSKTLNCSFCVPL
nr:hypothetical protein CACDSRKY_CACDSRKY_CDS_0026 [Caudoviricetes sp.]